MGVTVAVAVASCIGWTPLELGSGSVGGKTGGGGGDGEEEEPALALLIPKACKLGMRELAAAVRFCMLVATPVTF